MERGVYGEKDIGVPPSRPPARPPGSVCAPVPGLFFRPRVRRFVLDWSLDWRLYGDPRRAGVNDGSLSATGNVGQSPAFFAARH
jgi:hypothetical protein